jgi:hypothetical protein
VAVTAHAFALALVLALLWHVARADRSPARGAFVLFLALVAWWSACATLGAVAGWGAPDGAWAQRWERLGFVGAALVPLAWLVFVDCFIGRGRPRWSLVAALAVIPLATIALALLEPRVGWLLQDDGGTLVRGPWFWSVHVPYGYALLLAGGLVAWYGRRGASLTVRRQVGLLLGAAALPLAGSLLDLAGARPWPGVQFTVVGFAAGALALTVAVTQRRFLRLPPTSYRSRYAGLDEAVLFLDSGLHVVDRNDAAARLLPGSDQVAPPLGRLLPSVAAALPTLLEAGGSHEVHAPTLPGRRAHVVLTPLREGDRAPFGFVLTVRPLEPESCARVAAAPRAP